MAAPRYEDVKDIYIAAKTGHLDDIQAYIAKDAKLLEEKDTHGNTPLYYAALCGHYDIVTFLLRKGARDDQYRRAYYNCLTREIRAILRDYQVMQSFIENSNNDSSKTDGVGLKKTLRSIFQHHVKRVKVKLSEDQEEEDQEISSLHFTDFRIIVTNQEKTEQEIFYCHLFVLIARWPYFRNHTVYQFDPNTWNTVCPNTKDSEAFFQSQINIIQEKLLHCKNLIAQKRHQYLELHDLSPNFVFEILRFLYTNQFHLDHIVFENGPLSIDDRISKIKTILQWVKNFELEYDLNNFIFAYLCDQSLATHFSELNIKQHGKGKTLQDMYALEKSFRNSFTKTQFDTLDAHTLKILQSNFKGKSIKDWMTILNRYFIHRASMYCADVILKRDTNTLQQFWCHKLILISRNSYFRTLILGNFVESSHYKTELMTEKIPHIEIEAESDSLLENFVSFLYSDQKPTYSNALHLIPLAKRYLEEALVNECEDVLCSKVDSKNALELYFVSVDWNLSKLLNDCKTRLATECSIMSKLDYSKVMNFLIEANHVEFAKELECNALQLEFQNKTDDFKMYLEEDLQIYLTEARKNQLYSIEWMETDNGTVCNDCPFCKQNLWQIRKQRVNNYESKYWMSYYTHFAMECSAFEEQRQTMAKQCASFAAKLYKKNTYYPPMFPHWCVKHKTKIEQMETSYSNDVGFFLFAKLDRVWEHFEKEAMAQFTSFLLQKILSINSSR